MIFVEGKEDVYSLKKIINSIDTKIISFDFESHKLLDRMQIKHHLVEEYFDEKDQILVDEFAIQISTNWYTNKDIINFLEYHGINIGKLLEPELLQYFFSQIKRFIGILKIIQKENPNQVITSSLGNFLLPIKDGFEHVNYKSQQNNSLYFDIIEIPIKIGSKVLTLNISRENYQKIKKISDSIVSLFLSKEFNFSDTAGKKNILLVEFNPASYRNMLEELSKTKHNVILLNQRRPVIADLDSLKVIKNTRCKFFNLEKICDGMKEKIKIEQERITQNIKLLWSDDIFEEIFSINGYSFWNCIKNDFSILIEKRYNELIHKIILTESFFATAQIDLILDWAHAATEEEILSHFAKKKNIPIVTLQHGTYPTNEKFVQYLPLFSPIPHGNMIAVWGSIMMEYILKHGGDQNDIINIGSPKHDKFFMFNNQNRTNCVLIILSDLYGSNFEGTDSKTKQRLDEYLRITYNIIKKISNKKIIVKIRPVQSVYDGHQIINELDPNIPTYRTQDIFDVINMCDTVIAFNFSTAVVDAMILKKPTMTILPENQGFEDDVIMKSGATLVVNNLNELETKLVDILTNDKLRKKLVEDGQKIVNEYFINQGNASKELCRFIDSLLD